MHRLLLVLLCGWGMAAQAGLPELVAAAKPAVVAVGTFDPLASPRFNFRGTGFVVTDGRTLVTNAHVVPEETAAQGQLVLLVGGKVSGSVTGTTKRKQLPSPGRLCTSIWPFISCTRRRAMLRPSPVPP